MNQNQAPLHFSESQRGKEGERENQQLNQKQKNGRVRKVNIVLHIFMVLLCAIASFVFWEDSQAWITEWNSETLQTNNDSWIIFGNPWFVLSFVKTFIVIPSLVIGYFIYFVKNQILYRIIKAEYRDSYEEKYSTVYKIYEPYRIKMAEQAHARQLEEERIKKAKNNRIVYENYENRSYWQHVDEAGGDPMNSSMNMSIDMVRSMSKSMMGSLKNVLSTSEARHGKSFMNSSLVRGQSDERVPKASERRSSKIIEHLSKRDRQSMIGKGLSTLFSKFQRTPSETKLNASNVSSSGIGVPQNQKIRITNKTLDQRISNPSLAIIGESSCFAKYREENKKLLERFVETVKKEKLENEVATRIDLFERGLKQQIETFLKEYDSNTKTLIDTLEHFFHVKVQDGKNFSGNPSDSSKKISNLLSSGKQNNLENTKVSAKPENKKIITLEEVLENCASTRDVTHKILNSLKLEVSQQNKSLTTKSFHSQFLAEIKGPLEHRILLNKILNVPIHLIMSERESKKRYEVLKRASHLNSVLRFHTTSQEAQILEQDRSDSVRQIITTKLNILYFVINKINCLSVGDPAWKYQINMRDSVTCQSTGMFGHLFRGKQSVFAEVVCVKSYDSVIVHSGIVIQSLDSIQRAKKQLHGQPGLNNSLSVALFLCKAIQDEMCTRGWQTSSHQELQLKAFISNLYPTIRL